MEARSLSLLLCLFRGLLGVGKGQRVTASVSRCTSATASATTRVDVFSALVALLCTEFAEARRARGRCWGWTHADIRKGGLVATMGAGLGRGVHRDREVLLLLWHLHLLGELVVVDLGRDVGDLAWDLEVAKLLLWLDHAHVNILLVCCSDLLLLLLKDFDLLGDGELLHCTEGVSNVTAWGNETRDTYSSVVSARRDCGDAQCADDGRQVPWGPVGPAGLAVDP